MDGVGTTYEKLRGKAFQQFRRQLELVRAIAPFGINFVVNASTLPEIDAAEPLERGRTSMPNLYIEARPKNRPEHDPITDYVVEDAGDKVLQTFRTQAEAITWAKAQGHHPLVARVRHRDNNK
jgi:hypothetical protein